MTTKIILTQAEAAYLAGFMDGEGSFFCIYESKEGNRNGVKYTFQVSVVNTNYEVMEWIRDITGGQSIHVDHDGNENHKIRYKLKFNKNWILDIVPQFIDFLIIKKIQAKLVIEGILLKEPPNNYSNYNFDRLYDIYRQLKELNYRGTVQKYFPFPSVRSAVKKEERICGYPGCTKIHYGEGFCRKHYRRMLEIKKQNDASMVDLHNKFSLRKCENCGTPITDETKADAKFCSRECLVDFHSRKKKERTIARVHEEGRQIGVCQQCGKSFESKFASTRYCSDHCRSLSRAVGPVKKICGQCGNEFLAQRPNRKMFCSEKCLRRHRSQENKFSETAQLSIVT